MKARTTRTSRCDIMADEEIREIKSSVHITVTQGAAKVITVEEAEMLVKFVWPEIVKAGDHNAFTVPKLGLSVVRDGDELFIMTVEEKEAALMGEKAK